MGKTTAFFDCNAPEGDIAEETKHIRKVVKTPSGLELSLTKERDNLKREINDLKKNISADNDRNDLEKRKMKEFREKIRHEKNNFDLEARDIKKKKDDLKKFKDRLKNDVSELERDKNQQESRLNELNKKIPQMENKADSLERKIKSDGYNPGVFVVCFYHGDSVGTQHVIE